MKKAFSGVLTAVLLAGMLTGCGGQQAATGTPSVSQPSSSSGPTQSATPEAKPVEVKIFANWSPPEQSEADKAWAAAVEEATNTKISFEIPPSANYNERLNIMLAGGDYADVILFPDTTAKAFTDSVNNGVIIPVTQYVEKAENLQNYSYDMSWDALKIKGDDEIYGIPRTTIQRADGFLIRQDWLDAIGFKVPDDNLLTTDQFTEILTKFTFDDPDGNGKDDTFGWGSSQDGNGNIWPILDYPFGVLGWQKTNGGKYEYMTAMYSLEDDSYVKALEFTAMLYKKGVIDPNFTSIKSDAAAARFKQGITGAWAEFAGWIATNQADAEKINPNAKLTYINGIKNENGEFKRPSYGTGLWGCWSVTTAAENPEAVVNIFDYLLSDEGWAITKYGIENVTYTLEGDRKVATEAFSGFTWGPGSVRRNNDPEFFVKINMQEEYKEPVKKWLDTAIKGTQSSMDFGYRPAAADKPELIDYGKQMDQVRAKIILGELPSSEWFKAVEGWYAVGGEEYVQQMNEFIKKSVN